MTANDTATAIRAFELKMDLIMTHHAPLRIGAARVQPPITRPHRDGGSFPRLDGYPTRSINSSQVPANGSQLAPPDHARSGSGCGGRQAFRGREGSHLAERTSMARNRLVRRRLPNAAVGRRRPRRSVSRSPQCPYRGPPQSPKFPPQAGLGGTFLAGRSWRNSPRMAPPGSCRRPRRTAVGGNGHPGLWRLVRHQGRVPCQRTRPATPFPRMRA